MSLKTCASQQVVSHLSVYLSPPKLNVANFLLDCPLWDISLLDMLYKSSVILLVFSQISSPLDLSYSFETLNKADFFTATLSDTTLGSAPRFLRRFSAKYFGWYYLVKAMIKCMFYSCFIVTVRWSTARFSSKSAVHWNSL